VTKKKKKKKKKNQCTDLDAAVIAEEVLDLCLVLEVDDVRLGVALALRDVLEDELNHLCPVVNIVRDRDLFLDRTPDEPKEVPLLLWLEPRVDDVQRTHPRGVGLDLYELRADLRRQLHAAVVVDLERVPLLDQRTHGGDVVGHGVLQTRELVHRHVNVLGALVAALTLNPVQHLHDRLHRRKGETQKGDGRKGKKKKQRKKTKRDF
jgi:hypothetical protein